MAFFHSMTTRNRATLNVDSDDESVDFPDHELGISLTQPNRLRNSPGSPSEFVADPLIPPVSSPVQDGLNFDRISEPEGVPSEGSCQLSPTGSDNILMGNTSAAFIPTISTLSPDHCSPSNRLLTTTPDPPLEYVSPSQRRSGLDEAPAPAPAPPPAPPLAYMSSSQRCSVAPALTPPQAYMSSTPRHSADPGPVPPPLLTRPLTPPRRPGDIVLKKIKKRVVPLSESDTESPPESHQNEYSIPGFYSILSKPVTLPRYPALVPPAPLPTTNPPPAPRPPLTKLAGPVLTPGRPYIHETMSAGRPPLPAQSIPGYAHPVPAPASIVKTTLVINNPLNLARPSRPVHEVVHPPPPTLCK
jgi:hypothetical protein